MKAKFFWIPLILLVYFFTHYITEFFYFLHSSGVIKVFLKYVVVTSVFYFIGYKFSIRKKGFILFFSTTFFIFLFFGSFADTAAGLQIIESNKVPGIRAIISFLFAVVIIYWLCYKFSDNTIERLLKFWLIYPVVLITYDITIFIVKQKPEKQYLHSSLDHVSLQSSKKIPVFFLLFDMYPSDFVLKKYLSYNNSSIGNFLRSKNFFVTGNSSSLYSETYFSLSSTLNLKALNYLEDKNLSDYKKILIALKNVENASVPAAFINAGYTFRNFSVFNIADQKSPLQFNLGYHTENALTASTFYNRIYNSFETDFFEHNREINLEFLKPSWSGEEKKDISFLKANFDEVINSFPNKEPSFNYFHFMIPHPPVIYDSSGHELPLEDRYAFNNLDRSGKNFTGYIMYGNKVIETMVEHIFKKAGKDVVIIIQGDHGYREFKDHFPDEMRSGTMNAVYIPGMDYKGFSDSITVLQTFKQLLINEFKAEIKE